MLRFIALCFLLASSIAAKRNEAENSIETTVAGHTKEVVCYWGTWANYRPKDGKFTPEDIDPELCTNVIYSFVGLDSDTSSIKSLDPWMDLEENYALGGFRKATDLKRGHPHLKVTLAIGGWNEGSKKYSAMAKDESQRKKFANSAVLFLQKHDFDGLDLDWEYPGKRGGLPEDKTNFIHLIRDLRTAFDKHKLLLTAAIGAASKTIDVSYDVPLMYKYLDYVHVMCYDYHGKWDGKTGHNAPLYPAEEERGADRDLNVEYTINYLMKKGAKPEKTVLGVPLYGRAFTLKNPHDNGMRAKTKATSFQGPYTREDGFLGYNEICEEQMEQDNPWTTVWEESHEAPYMHKGLKWVSYDNVESIKKKSYFAMDQKLAGVMVWSIDTDDFRGKCGGPKFPLLRTINKALFESESGTRAGSGSNAASVAVVVVAAVLSAVFNRL